ncbi:hypothetical protein bcgnr5390_17200 [Bacillus luti]|nr:hypothetical protein BC2903_54460 [Bacillus cereus]
MTHLQLRIKEMENKFEQFKSECNPDLYRKSEFGPTKKQCIEMLDLINENEYGKDIRALVKEADKTKDMEVVLSSASVCSTYIKYTAGLKKVQLTTEIRDPELRKQMA